MQAGHFISLEYGEVQNVDGHTALFISSYDIILFLKNRKKKRVSL